MLKRIDVQHLRPGMYVQELYGSWLDHPFWRKSFALKDSTQIEEIRACNITEVCIDTARGLDITDEAVAGPTGDAPVVQHDTAQDSPSAAAKQPRTSLQVELKEAARVCAKAKPAIVSMFREARMGRALDVEQVLPLVEEISSSVQRNPGALISLARLKSRDDYTFLHSVAVCALMVALARELGLGESDTREAALGGLVHDIGKAMVPLDLLNKPGKLTREEFAVIKQHPMAGHQMLQESRGAGPIALDICLHHHEKIDGSGYPERLVDDKLSLFARMGAVCDVYDAITSNRPYKDGWDPSESLRRMAEWSSTQFDPRVFQAFVKSLGIYPIGSLVRLESGLIGVVADQNPGALLTPKVRVFYSARRKAMIAPSLLDLSRPDVRDGIACRENPADWPFGDTSRYWGGKAAATVSAAAA